MGNHEYCINCGESDFHYGRLCDPIKVAVRLAREEKIYRANVKALARLEEVLAPLGIKYEIIEGVKIEIRISEFSDEVIAWREERSKVKVPCERVWKVPAGWDDEMEYKCVREIGHHGPCRAFTGVSE